MENLERDVNGMDKIGRYGWTTKNQQGNLSWINKRDLLIDTKYQRDAVQTRVLTIAKAWSWIACGTIIVVERNGVLFVIDGQHRVLAAQRRSDIEELPCIVFQSESIKQEAEGFIDSNTLRRAMTGLEKHKANILAEDKDSIFVNGLIESLGIKFSKAPKAPMTFNGIIWALKQSKISRHNLSVVMELASVICTNDPVRVKLISGLMYLQVNTKEGLEHGIIRERIIKIGYFAIFESIKKSNIVWGRGTADSCGAGILEAVNKNLRTNRVKLVNEH